MKETVTEKQMYFGDEDLRYSVHQVLRLAPGIACGRNENFSPLAKLPYLII